MLILPVSLPGLITDPKQRALFREAQQFVQTLPERLKEPLPISLKRLDSDSQSERPNPKTERTTRNLTDLAILMHRRSPLGICLRRSLTRYYFLRREGLPLRVHFGAKFVDGKPDREVTGHAWLTLDGEPYYEPGENWQGFTEMLAFPNQEKRPDASS